MESKMWLTTADVAEMAQLSKATINKIASHGWMPKPFLGASTKRAQKKWRREDIERWVAKGCPREQDEVKD